MDRTSSARRVMTAGQQLFFKNQTWTISIIELSQWGGLIELKGGLALNEGDRVQVKIGNLPSFPGTVEGVVGDRFNVDFEMPVNARVVDAVNAERLGL